MFLFIIGCKIRFYTFESFEIHNSQVHQNQLKYSCNKCSQNATNATIKEHLINCHNIHAFHCCYCAKTGFERQGNIIKLLIKLFFLIKLFLDLMSAHLTKFHPDKIPFYFERRITLPNIDASSIEAVAIRKFALKDNA